MGDQGFGSAKEHDMFGTRPHFRRSKKQLSSFYQCLLALGASDGVHHVEMEAGARESIKIPILNIRTKESQ